MKWFITVYTYESGEVVSTDLYSYLKDGKDYYVYGETEEEVKEFIKDFSCLFESFDPVEADPTWYSNIITCSEVKKLNEDEENRRKRYLPPCPFCGMLPVRTDSIFAFCEGCNIRLPEEKWRDRKYRW